MNAPIEILSLGYVEPAVGCEKARWFEIFRPFDARARYHAANLAAHNWDVLLVGERVFLFQTKYGGELGHWLNPDGSREDSTKEQMRQLYRRSGEDEQRSFARKFHKAEKRDVSA